MPPELGIVLLCHGSRDPEWIQPFQAIRDALNDRSPQRTVSLACLQFGAPTLQAAVEDLVDKGTTHISVVPLFMSRGGHMVRDVETRMDALRQNHPGSTIHLTPTIGELPGVREAIVKEVLALTHDSP